MDTLTEHDSNDNPEYLEQNPALPISLILHFVSQYHVKEVTGFAFSKQFFKFDEH